MTTPSDIPRAFEHYRLQATANLDERIQQAATMAAFHPDKRPSGWRRIMQRAGKIAAVAALLFFVTPQRSPQALAWSDVTKRFAHADFVQVSLYIPRKYTGRPAHVQFWLGPNGLAKLESDQQIVWTQHGRILRVAEHEFDTDRPIRRPFRRPIRPAIREVLRHLPYTQGVSLDILIQVLAKGPVHEITHTLDQNAAMMPDLAVFEGTSSVTDGRVRLYALRDSMLPIAFEVTESNPSVYSEAFLTYPPMPDPSFFDPKAHDEGMLQ